MSKGIIRVFRRFPDFPPLSDESSQTETQYSTYVKMFNTLKGDATETIDNLPKNDLLSMDLLNCCVSEEPPKVIHLVSSIKNLYRNGHGKSFWNEILSICSDDLCLKGYSAPRETSIDGFELERSAIQTTGQQQESLRYLGSHANRTNQGFSAASSPSTPSPNAL